MIEEAAGAVFIAVVVSADFVAFGGVVSSVGLVSVDFWVDSGWAAPD